MEKVKILIVEDEYIIAESLDQWLSDMEYEICEIADSGEEAIKIYERDRPDLVLMDIHLSGKMDGIETAMKIKGIMECPVIFLTAFADSPTLEKAKKATPAAYIIKPFRQNDLKVAIEVALYNFSSARGANFGLGVPRVLAPDNCYVLQERIFIKSKAGRFHKILLDEILWLEAVGNYSNIVTLTQKHLISVSISDLLDKIAHPLFLKVHRSFAVNLQKVDAFEETRLFIKDTEIPISKANRGEFTRRFIMP